MWEISIRDDDQRIFGTAHDLALIPPNLRFLPRKDLHLVRDGTECDLNIRFCPRNGRGRRHHCCIGSRWAFRKAGIQKKEPRCRFPSEVKNRGVKVSVKSLFCSFRQLFQKVKTCLILTQVYEWTVNILEGAASSAAPSSGGGLNIQGSIRFGYVR